MVSLVSLQSVSKTYTKGRERVDVLSDLSLDIEKNDFVALMGPSGSGKTTVLNLIGGLDHPTSGDVVVDGASLKSLSPGKLARWRSQNIGFVFQFYNLLPALTAQRNIELPLLLTKLRGKERKQNALTALDIVGLGDRSKHKPSQLSGGQQQRVAIARAIVADPSILVCDEPTGDLDRANAEEILDLLQTLNQKHEKTIVMVTHDPKAADHAKTTVYLDKGQLTVQEPVSSAS
ncbi:MAG: ABC transporter ATP-binding protein [Gammaproteobacteria bacterium]|nr:ABC transporter ATP-binding protein [Gammaproteobacteria bacterium]MYD79941.1 ABC transporter ATP-binding protein [Gammaproteobacteria bacterium]